MVGDISFQKMYGLYGLKHHIVEISGDVTDAGRTTTRKDRATQLLICEALSFAKYIKYKKYSILDIFEVLIMGNEIRPTPSTYLSFQ